MIGKTIKGKIIIFSCSLLLLVVFCQIIFSVFLSEKYYISRKKFHVEALFYNIKNNYSDDENLIRQITQYSENAYNINIEIFNNNGLIYWSRGQGILASDINFGAYVNEPKAIMNSEPKMQIRPPVHTASLEEAKLPAPGSFTYPDSPEAPNFSGLPIKPPPPPFAEKPPMPRLPDKRMNDIVLSGKFDYNGETRYVRIMSFVESINESVKALTTVNTFISGFILIAGIIGAYIFARNFSRPIRNIKNVAMNVALLNFETKANENLSTMELRDLSVSINTMADKLSCLISDLQLSNEKLQADIDYQMKLDKMRRDFIANVSHELKTPLHLLLMYSENLKNNIENIDKEYYCNTIIDETNRMNEMVNSLLDLSAIENELGKINKEKFNLSDFSKHALAKMDLLFGNLKVNINIEEDIFAEADSRYIEQMIKNYLINAVSHTPAQGHISVELKRQEKDAVFSIFNEGNPIEAQDLPHIWESFYKTDKARVRTDENHTGLGLYVVKTIIQAHGGNYGARNVKNGVEFWFSLAITQNYG